MSVPGTVRRSLAESIRLAGDRLRHAPRRVLATWLIQALVLLVLGWLLPGVEVDDPLAALLGSAVIAGLNALVRPIIVVLTLPLTVATFGLLSLIINTSMVVLAAPLVPGLDVAGFLPALALALILTVVTTTVNVALAIDEDVTFYAELARRIQTGDVPADGPRPNGLVVIQIDGLAAPILRNAIRVGTVPRMASWVRSGAYTLDTWDCPPPSQTSASQAGILHGRNDDIPAFRWYEKEAGRLLVSNHPADATEIERRVSDGRGLLAAGGTSVGNLFSGDARRNAFVMSRMGNAVGDLDIDAFSLYFIDPAAFIRTVVLGVGEFTKELVEARRQRQQDIQPRIHRGTTFAFLRAATNVVLRDLNTTFVVRSMSLGAPVIYVDFTDYDEIAHHAGPERIESLRALTGVDRVIAALERAGKSAPRDYHFVILSDHGQSQGATFRQRFGTSLEDVVRELMGGEAEVVGAGGSGGEAVGVNALLAELAQRPGVTGRAGNAMLRRQGAEGTPAEEAEETGITSATEVVVCASGNLANIYFTADRRRLRATEIEERYPGLLDGLVRHPGVSFVMVDSVDGPLVLGADGVRYLRDDRVTGTDPLAAFGERAGDHLRRLDAFTHVGDLLVNSVYDEELGEVAAFEELVGSHGGMGGPQTEPFLLHPTKLGIDEAPIVGSPAVHDQLQRWATALEVSRPLRSAGEAGEALPEPRGLGWIAAWQLAHGALLLLLGVVAVAGAMLSLAEHLPLELVEGAALVSALLIGVGSVNVASAYGLWRRRRWAWMLTLVLQGLNVLQALLALASGGFTGLVQFGIVSAVVAVVVFYYLTRPHVAAVFRSVG